MILSEYFLTYLTIYLIGMSVLRFTRRFFGTANSAHLQTSPNVNIAKAKTNGFRHPLEELSARGLLAECTATYDIFQSH